MQRVIWLCSALLLSTVPASAQLGTWQSNKQQMTPQGVPFGGNSSGGAYQQGQPAPPSRPSPPSGISCAKSFNPFYNAEIYEDRRASDAMCNPQSPPRYDNPASAGPAKLNKDLIEGAKKPASPPSKPTNTVTNRMTQPKDPSVAPYREPESTFPDPGNTFDPIEQALTRTTPTQPRPQQYQYRPPQVTSRGTAQCQQAMSALLNGAPGSGSYERAVQLQNWYNANCR
jgi:hypothetical protein